MLAEESPRISAHHEQFGTWCEVRALIVYLLYESAPAILMVVDKAMQHQLNNYQAVQF